MEQKKLVHFMLTEEEKKKLAIYSATLGTSMSQVIRQAINEYLASHKTDANDNSK